MGSTNRVWGQGVQVKSVSFVRLMSCPVSCRVVTADTLQREWGVPNQVWHNVRLQEPSLKATEGIIMVGLEEEENSAPVVMHLQEPPVSKL